MYMATKISFILKLEQNYLYNINIDCKILKVNGYFLNHFTFSLEIIRYKKTKFEWYNVLDTSYNILDTSYNLSIFYLYLFIM